MSKIINGYEVKICKHRKYSVNKDGKWSRIRTSDLRELLGVSKSCLQGHFKSDSDMPNRQEFGGILSAYHKGCYFYKTAEDCWTKIAASDLSEMASTPLCQIQEAFGIQSGDSKLHNARVIKKFIDAVDVTIIYRLAYCKDKYFIIKERNGMMIEPWKQISWDKAAALANRPRDEVKEWVKIAKVSGFIST